MSVSRFPGVNTVDNGQGGTTTVIGNMMIITGYFSSTSGSAELIITFPTFLDYRYRIPPVVTCNTGIFFDLPAYTVLNSISITNFSIEFVYGGNYRSLGGNPVKVSYIAVGII